MKAIHYKGQNKFYLFDKPEETEVDPDFECAGSPMEYLEEKYNREFEANLSAGKEIINPEVLPVNFIGDKPMLLTGNPRLLKPGDIFDCPPRLESILKLKDEVKAYRIERPSEYGDGVIGTEIVGSPENQNDFDRFMPCGPQKKKRNRFEKHLDFKVNEANRIKKSMLETQDQLWSDVIATILKHSKNIRAELKSKFTITRNENI